MAELATLKRKRGGIKHKISNFRKFIEKFSEEEATDVSTKELQERLDSFVIVKEEFAEVQTKIECECQENELENEYTVRDEMDDIFYKLVAQARVLLVEFCSSRDEGMSIKSGSEEGRGHNMRDTSIKLPTIKLPVFDGNFNDWLEFRDAFIAIVHSNSTLSKVQKLYYLKASLQKDALDMVRSIESTDDNYDVTWDMLLKRFDNSRTLIKRHVRALLTLPSITKDSCAELRGFKDAILKHLNCLRSLRQPVENWDIIIQVILLDKLDKTNLKEFETLHNKNEDIKLEDLIEFLQNKCNLLESIENKEVSQLKPKFKSQSLLSQSPLVCYFCRGSHSIYKCEPFMKLSPQERRDKLVEMKRCLKCFRTNHTENACKFRSCSVCGQAHNSMLHIEKIEGRQNISTASHCVANNKYDLLSTAKVYASNVDGELSSVRALTDTGSQDNYITEAVAVRLGIPIKRRSWKASVMGAGETSILGVSEVILTAVSSDYSRKIMCLVVRKITNDLPAVDFSNDEVHLPERVKLADPEFNRSGTIDMLIGSTVFWSMFQNDVYHSPYTKWFYIKLRLGWVVAGRIPIGLTTWPVSNLSTMNNLPELMEKFWNVESLDTVETEDYCEDLFCATTKRSSNGQFVVRVPFKQTKDQISNTFKVAHNRLVSIEKRFLRDVEFQDLYVNFMKDYERLGHMSKTYDSSTKFYLPHHGVLKQDAISTKLRVVFDGSATGDDGLSLNSAQHTGPKIQNDLLNIMLRFRQYQYAVTADIKQMYRQILIHEDDRPYQRILWRNEVSSDIQTYQLNTVTYGTASAPYLAIRCLKELSIANAEDHPEISRVIRDDFYVDDVLTGGNSEEEVIDMCQDLVKVLAQGHFPLHKWASNSKLVMRTVSSDVGGDVDLASGGDTKALGIWWQSEVDEFYFKFKVSRDLNTKRELLSHIASFFDPLGLISPIIITGKIAMQRLWSLKIEWDDVVPREYVAKWLTCCEGLDALTSLRVPRFIFGAGAREVELHGFCDSSGAAYGAVIYARSVDAFGNVTSKILCSKTRVAPLKELTIPRLELCAAALLVDLMKIVSESLTVNFREFYWSDSMVVLQWIQTDPNKLNVFVANRVRRILSMSTSVQWHYVNTKQNPADLLSRGVIPVKLVNCKLWWEGPEWLTSNSICVETPEPVELPEVRKTCVLLTCDVKGWFPFERFSSFQKLIRVVAYMLRFKISSINRGPIVQGEFLFARMVVLRLAQEEVYSDEIACLGNGGSLPRRSSLLKLNPYLDDTGLLRVGGRLQNSDYGVDKMHPIIVPPRHRVGELILQAEHVRLLHAGPQQLLSSTRDQYWIVSGRVLAKKVVHSCVRCIRYRANHLNPIMGNLPKHRVTETFPFHATGIDYAGPFLIRDKRGRGARQIKCYICVFVCMATKCLHLEIVTDLTTDGFIAVLRRFISRRGHPAHFYSDNGRNFVGASRELDELYALLRDSADSLVNVSADLNIKWHFMPPYAPNFGGLWESGVKSVKYHLKRTLTVTSLVFEEFYTVVVQIEGILNSRPLSPLSSDPDDLLALTPAHFLIGRPITMLADHNLDMVKLNRMSRWQYIQHLQQQFWQRWRKEYINSLQIRTKWCNGHDEIEVGQLVLIKDDNALPATWPLARVVRIHPGKDGITRVVTLKTSSGETKRSLRRVCPLPKED